MWYGLVNYSQYEARRHWAHSKSVLKSHVRSYQSTSFFFFLLYLDFKQLHFALWPSLPATWVSLFIAQCLESIFQL